MANEEHVFCVDCKYSTGSNFLSTWWMRLIKSEKLRCTKNVQQRSETNLITGKTIVIRAENPYCTRQRDSNYNCGEKGRDWVPYNKHKMFLYIKRTGND